MSKITRIARELAFAAFVVAFFGAPAYGQWDPTEGPTGDPSESAIDGGGVALKDIDLNGAYKLILDTDADTYWTSTAGDDTPQLYVGGAAKIQVSTTNFDVYTSGGVRLGAGTYPFRWTSASRLTAPADGDLLLTNDAATYALLMRVSGNGTATLWNSGVTARATLSAGSWSAVKDTGLGKTTVATPSTATVTFAAGPGGDASKTATGLIPAGCFLVGFSSRVVTTGTNCASVNIGTAGDPDYFCAACTLIDNDTSDNTDFTATIANPFTAATDVTVTGVGANCFALKMDLYAHCMTVTAATADLP